MTQDELRGWLDRLGIQGIRPLGRGFQACCPNHQENRPSWGISYEPPHPHGCFACEFKGTLFTLLIKIGKFKPAEAAKIVGKEGIYQDRKDWTLPMLEEKDKITMKTIDESELYPFKPVNFGTGFTTLQKRGITIKTAKALNLRYDHQTHRILVPWMYESENDNTLSRYLVGVTGLLTEKTKDKGGKSMAYFGTKKSQCLYLPSGFIVKDKPLILVEGEYDAMKVWQSGFKNVGAMCYGGFSVFVAKLISSQSSEVICFMDDDYRGIELSRLISESLAGTSIKVSHVNYDQIASGEETQKLDPAVLEKPDISKLLQGAESEDEKSADWPSI